MEAEIEDFLEGFNQPTYRGMTCSQRDSGFPWPLLGTFDHLKTFYCTRHRESTGHDSSQTPQNRTAADDDERSDNGIMGDNRAPHAASRAEQVLIGRIPAHGSREGHGGCNIWT